MTAGFTDQGVIDLAGAGFQAAIVLGGIVLGLFVLALGGFVQTNKTEHAIKPPINLTPIFCKQTDS